MKQSGNVQRGPSSQGSERTFMDYMATISRGKWTIAIALILSVGGAVLLTQLMNPVYKASCQVLLNMRELQSSLFIDAVRPVRGENITQNELAVLTSRTLADSVAARLISQRVLDPGSGQLIPVILMPKELSPRDSVAPLSWISGTLRSMIDFEPVRESDVITFTAMSENPAEAALIANTFAEEYRDRNIYASRSKSRVFKEFLADQAEEKRRELEATEGELQRYMERQGIVSLDDEAKKVIDQLAELEAQRDATEISLRELQNTLNSYKEQLPQQETNVARAMGEASDPYIRLLQEQLARLEVQRDVIVAQNPSLVGRDLVDERVREIDTQISSLRLNLQKRTDEFLRSLTPGAGASDAAGYLKSVRQKIIETQIEVQALEEKKKALESQIHQYEQEFNRIPQKSVELARLQRSRVTNEKVYLMVEEKYNEANITEKSNIGYVEIIERAAVPRRPASPKPLINIALGVVFGLGLGLLIVFGRESLDVKVYSPEDLKRKGYTPLGTLVKYDTPSAALRQSKKVGESDALPLVTVLLPFSPVAEAYRQLRTNVQFARAGVTPKTILVTSPTPGDGKSTTAANLAVAFAQAGKRTLLVDADLRRPSLEGIFRARVKPGLAELLSDHSPNGSAVQGTAVQNLWIITCGTVPPNPAELLSSAGMQELVSEAANQYDVVVFDSSPVLAVTDPSVVATMVDEIVVVVSSGKTRMRDLEHAIEQLAGVGGKIGGVIVNNFDPRKAYGFVYGRQRKAYYYGYGGSPGGKAAERPAPPVAEQA